MSNITSEELKALEKAMQDAYARMGENLRKAQDTADQALAESKKYGGVIEAKTQDTLKALDENRVKVQEEVISVRQQVLDLAQKLATVPQGGSGAEQKSLYDIIVNSDQWKDASKRVGANTMDPVMVGNFHRFGNPMATQITNDNPLTNDQPLVPAQRVPGLIT